jgi:hypothetical protein
VGSILRAYSKAIQWHSLTRNSAHRLQNVPERLGELRRLPPAPNRSHPDDKTDPPDRTLLRATYLPTHLPVAGRHRHRSRAGPCRAFSLSRQSLSRATREHSPLPSERHCYPRGPPTGRCPCCPTTRAHAVVTLQYGIDLEYCAAQRRLLRRIVLSCTRKRSRRLCCDVSQVCGAYAELSSCCVRAFFAMIFRITSRT